MQDEGGRIPLAEVRLNWFEVKISRQAGAGVVVVVWKGGWYEVDTGLEVVYGGGDG